MNNKIDSIKSTDLSEIKNECNDNLQKHKNETEKVVLVIKDELQNLGDKQKVLYDNLNATRIPSHLRL